MKNRIVKILSCVFSLALVFSLISCGKTPADTAERTDSVSTLAGTSVSTEKETDSTEAVQPSGDTEPGTDGTSDGATEPEVTDKAPVAEHKKVLVVFFSATGTTRRAAEMIASIEDADIHEIKARDEYTEADLNWHDSGSRTTKEQNDKNARPAIGYASVSFEGYERIYIGYPIWWGEEPRIMDTFVEAHDFSGITVIPFCTSSSSGMGRSGKNLAENAKSGTWLDGKRFGAGVSESDLRSWIEGLK